LRYRCSYLLLAIFAVELLASAQGQGFPDMSSLTNIFSGGGFGNIFGGITVAPTQVNSLTVGASITYTANDGTQHTATYSGCYPGGIPTTSTTTNAQQTPATCLTYCRSLGYIYAGLASASSCYCSSANALNGYSPQQYSSNCNTPCSGDATQFCGGSNLVSIWSITDLTVQPNGWNGQNGPNGWNGQNGPNGWNGPNRPPYRQNGNNGQQWVSDGRGGGHWVYNQNNWSTYAPTAATTTTMPPPPPGSWNRPDRYHPQQRWVHDHYERWNVNGGYREQYVQGQWVQMNN